MAEDNVNHPSHYNQYKGVEVIDLTEQMNFNRGNAVKYICRAGYKDAGNLEKEIEDLAKAAFYINREIERLKKGVEFVSDSKKWTETWKQRLYWDLKTQTAVSAFQFNGSNVLMLKEALGAKSYSYDEDADVHVGYYAKVILHFNEGQKPRQVDAGDWVIVASKPRDTYTLSNSTFVKSYGLQVGLNEVKGEND